MFLALTLTTDFGWWSVTATIFAIGALISTGAFVQKSKDNSDEIIQLKERVSKLESERAEVATLNNKMLNIETRFTDLKVDMRAGFEEIKTILRSHKRD